MTADLSDTPRTRVVAAFRARFGAAPAFVARAPGRVNLIGEHTDYNDGWVLPMAIERAVWIAYAPRADDHVRVHSLELGDAPVFSLGALDATPPSGAARPSGWGEYVRGVAWAYAELGLAGRTGWDGVVGSDIPAGAGLSSSAALQVAAARVCSSVWHLPWEPMVAARVAQRSENAWVGVACGIMDPMASAGGIAGHALLLDCRTLVPRAVPIPRDAAVVVLDTATRRELVDSAYNDRRDQCAAAARQLRVRALRDVSPTSFAEHAGELDPVVRRRARHVVTENGRTLAAADALRAGDVREAGRLMRLSHESLRDDFEVSGPELDAMVASAHAHPACHGARMTGAGFGGCAVALVDAAAIDEFTADVLARYERATGLAGRAHPCQASSGASLEGDGSSG